MVIGSSEEVESLVRNHIMAVPILLFVVLEVVELLFLFLLLLLLGAEDLRPQVELLVVLAGCRKL